MENTKRKLTKKQIIALFLAFALLCAFVLCFVFYKYYYYEFYGFMDGLRIGEKWVLKRTFYDNDELRYLSVSDFAEENSDVIFSTSLWLVNTEYMLSDDTKIKLVSVNELHSVTEEAYSHLMILFDACAEATGEILSITSSFRTYEKQESIYAVNEFAVPAGASEHQCGLAVDVRTDEYASLDFIKSAAGKWLARHAHEYGFIIRYPYWAEDITGVTYEPWHLRYVGEPHAEIIYRTKSVLEEYSSLYKDGEFYVFEDYVISHQTAAGGTLYIPNDVTDVYVSEDNAGGYYVWGIKSDA